MSEAVAMLPRTIGDCRGPGICPILRCRWNLLLDVQRKFRRGKDNPTNFIRVSGTKESITVRATRHVRSTERDCERLANAVVARADTLPATCLWDLVELPTNNDEPLAPHMTLDEIGKIFGLNRENIRLIEVRAFERLRRLSSTKELDPEFVPLERVTKREPTQTVC